MKRVLIARGSHALIVIALVVWLVGLLDTAGNVVAPGVRCGPYILGKTTEREVEAIRIDDRFPVEGLFRSGARLDPLQMSFAQPHANWIHIVFSKAAIDDPSGSRI